MFLRCTKKGDFNNFALNSGDLVKLGNLEPLQSYVPPCATCDNWIVEKEISDVWRTSVTCSKIQEIQGLFFVMSRFAIFCIPHVQDVKTLLILAALS